MENMANLKTIAEQTGVSITAVSRVLNGDSTLSISEAKRKLIQEIAEQIGYKTPRSRADSLVRSKLRIGVVSWYSDLEEIEDPYYLAIRLSVERECLSREFDMVRLYLRDKQLSPKVSEKIDGVIALGRFDAEEMEQLAALSDLCVTVDSSPDESRYDSVVIDMGKAVGDILRYLIENGHREIGYIGAHNVFGGKRIPDDREAVFRECLSERGFYRQEHIHIGDRLCAEEGYLLMKLALAQGKLPTAFFIENDSMAAGALRMLHEAKVGVPSEVSIVGFNDNTISAYLQPPLTTVKVHVEFMGETAVGLLADRLESNRSICKKVVIPTQLMIRESVSKI